MFLENRFHPVDALVAGIVGMIAFSLLLPMALRTREAARAELCENRLTQLGEAIHNYHSAFNRLPAAVTGTDGNDDRRSNRGRLSGFAALLPFIDQQPAWQELSRPNADSKYPAMGPSPSTSPSDYALWGHQVDLFLCPADPVQKKDYGLRSYAFCYGDGINGVGRRIEKGASNAEARAVHRGAFGPSIGLGFRECLDGLSNTIFISETVINIEPRDTSGAVARDVAGLADAPARIQDAVDPTNRELYQTSYTLWAVGKGSRWPEGTFICNAFTTNVPPNSASGTLPNDPLSGCVAASSHHIGGVHVMMGDGSLRMINDAINVGDQNAKSVCLEHRNAAKPSPYGVWGAMGTRANREVIPSEAEAAFNSIYPTKD